MACSLLNKALPIVAALALAACQREPANNVVRGEAPTAPTVPTPPPAPAKPPPTSFAGMDSDGDGSISEAEHQASAAAMFSAMDWNGNSMVSAAEMDTALAPLGGSTAMSSADKIKVVDSNGDGMLAKVEYVAGTAAMFDTMDVDRSGTLSEAEYDAGHKAMLGK